MLAGDLLTIANNVVCFRVFIEERLGPKYTEGRSVDFAKSYQEASPTTPIFFILSPGVDPLKVSKYSFPSQVVFQI